MKGFATVVFYLSLISYAWAHGYIYSVQVNEDRKYTGAYFGSGSTDSVVRTITTQDPNYGFDNPALNCGNGAIPVEKFVEANPGDRVTLHWIAGEEVKWPHDDGPVLYYMAKCTNGDCKTFDSSKAKWFKISQDGLENGKWIQETLMQDAGIHTTIPDGLAPGQYLMRNEIIALHTSGDPEGPEFYPSCIQFEIGGNGSGEPAKSDLVQFPGAYKKGDPGLDNMFDHHYKAGEKYQFPGPKIASFINGGDGGATNGGNADDDDNTTVPDGQSTSAGTATSSSYSATSTPGNNDDEDGEGEGDWDDEVPSTVSDGQPTSTGTATSSSSSATSTSANGGGGGGGDYGNDGGDGWWDDESTSSVSDGDSSVTGTATSTSSSPSSTSTSCNRFKKMKKRAPMLNGSLYTPAVAKRADALNRPRHVSLIKRAWQRISA